MSYSQFHDGFWTDPEIRSLSSDDKLLLTWFITNPYRHYSGLYFFEFDSIQKQTGLSEKMVVKGIDTLSREGFIKYNVKFSMVWVIKMAQHEVRKNEKTENYSDRQIKGIANHLLTLHKCPLIADFLSYYDTLSIPYARGIRQEEEKEETKTKEKTKTETKVTPPANGLDPDFLQFWEAYPKKTGKQDAASKWKSLKKKKILPEIGIILAAVKDQTGWEQWQKDDGQFIPNPATWLNQGRWDDKPPVVGRRMARVN